MASERGHCSERRAGGSTPSLKCPFLHRFSSQENRVKISGENRFCLGLSRVRFFAHKSNLFNIYYITSSCTPRVHTCHHSVRGSFEQRCGASGCWLGTARGRQTFAFLHLSPLPQSSRPRRTARRCCVSGPHAAGACVAPLLCALAGRDVGVIRPVWNRPDRPRLLVLHLLECLLQGRAFALPL